MTVKQITPGSRMDAGVPSVPDAGPPPESGPSSGRSSGGMDAGVPPPPPSYSAPRTLAYSLAEMGAAFQERTRLLSDGALLGRHLETFRSGRSTTYGNMALAILRVQYYLQRSQSDLSSVRTPLEAWVREAQSSTDPVLTETLTRLLENLRALTQTFNVERGSLIVGLIEELQQPPVAAAPSSPDAGSASPPASAPPPTASTPPPSTRDRRRRPDAGTPSPTPDAGTAPTTRPDAGAPPPSRPDAGTPPASRPDAGTPPASRPDAGAPPARSSGGMDAGVPPPPPPRSRRPILPPADGGVR